jgi:hypothetical protein
MATVVTGKAWAYEKAKKRWWAEFDPDARRVIPVYWDDFFADLESPYASHLIIAESPIVCIGSSWADGAIRPFITTDGTGAPGRFYSFTVRGIALSTESDDQTLWLKLVQQ